MMSSAYSTTVLDVSVDKVRPRLRQGAASWSVGVSNMEVHSNYADAKEAVVRDILERALAAK